MIQSSLFWALLWENPRASLLHEWVQISVFLNIIPLYSTAWLESWFQCQLAPIGNRECYSQDLPPRTLKIVTKDKFHIVQKQPEKYNRLKSCLYHENYKTYCGILCWFHKLLEGCLQGSQWPRRCQLDTGWLQLLQFQLLCSMNPRLHIQCCMLQCLDQWWQRCWSRDAAVTKQKPITMVGWDGPNWTHITESTLGRIRLWCTCWRHHLSTKCWIQLWH